MSVLNVAQVEVITCNAGLKKIKECRTRRSPAPPAGWKDPFGIGVEEPPGENEGRNDEQAEDLIAAGELLLAVAGLLLGLLF